MVATQLPENRPCARCHALTINRLNPQACRPEISQNGVRYTTTSSRIDSRGRLLPNHYLICRLRDAATRFETRLVVESELRGLRKPHSGRIKHTGPSGTTTKTTKTFQSTMSLEMYSKHRYQFSQVRRLRNSSDLCVRLIHVRKVLGLKRPPSLRPYLFLSHLKHRHKAA
jgi:hypothetical protein